jgi:hypothetical protein
MNLLTLTTTLIKSVLLCSLLTLPLAQANEQKTTEKPSTQKTAKSAAKILSTTKAGAVKHKGENKLLARPTSKSILVNPANNNNSNHEVWFYSVSIDMFDDPNNNGYFNHIVVDFDVDTEFDHIDVYAVLSLTDPNGITTSYYTTDDFGLNGESTSDTHQVDTVLTSNWMAEGYDLSIDIYDSYTHDLVASVDKYDAPQMGYLTLESLDYEYYDEQYLSVFSSSLWLDNDSDGDGYYHKFNIDLDVDVSYGSREVYAELYISTDQYSWVPLFTSDHFVISNDDASDQRHWEFNLLSGHPPGHYYIKTMIIDANSHYNLLEILSEDYAAFYAIPLEDLSFEVSSIPTTPNDTTRTTDSHESGGNMGGPVLLLVMMVFGLTRRLYANKK